MVLPPGYLQGAYAEFRQHGAICIADEVRLAPARPCSWLTFVADGLSRWQLVRAAGAGCHRSRLLLWGVQVSTCTTSAPAGAHLAEAASHSAGLRRLGHRAVVPAGAVRLWQVRLALLVL